MRDLSLIRQLRLVRRAYKDGREWGTAGLSEPGDRGMPHPLSQPWGRLCQPHYCPSPPPPLCVQMDFTRTFQANTKCNNINHVWSQFKRLFRKKEYQAQSAVVYCYCAWYSFFRNGCYEILVVLKYHVCVKDIGSRASMVLQNYQKLIEIT
jgi:hypothetical protein